MYSEKLMQMIKGKDNLYKIIWLILPVQIIFLSALSYFLIQSGTINAAVFGDSQLLIVTIAASGFIFIPVVGGIFLSITLFKLKFDFSRAAKLSTPNNELNSEFAQLEPIEQHIFSAYNQISIKVLIICAIFELPVTMGLVLSILSVKAIFSLAGAFVSLALWKVFIPSIYEFKKRFHHMVDSQLEQSTEK